MQVAGAVLAVLAPASAVAGWWSLGGLVLAAALALCAGRTATGGDPDRITEALHAVSRLTMVAVLAQLFAAYVVPAWQGPGALALVAVVAVADGAGARIDVYWRRWCCGLLLVAAAAFVVLCAGIEPVAQAGGGPDLAPGVLGVPASAALAYPAFAGMSGARVAGRGRAALAVAALAALAVAAAALYQLGPGRLGLSPTWLRDALAAADAGALAPALGAVVALATVPGALLAFTDARVAARSRRPLVGTAVAGGAVGLVALAVPSTVVVVLAAAASLVTVLVTALRARSSGAAVWATGLVPVVLLGSLVVSAWAAATA